GRSNPQRAGGGRDNGRPRRQQGDRTAARAAARGAEEVQPAGDAEAMTAAHGNDARQQGTLPCRLQLSACTGSNWSRETSALNQTRSAKPQAALRGYRHGTKTTASFSAKSASSFLVRKKKSSPPSPYRPLGLPSQKTVCSFSAKPPGT